MVKKTGNIFIFLIVLFSFLQTIASSKLSLQIADLQQNKVTQVEVGVPFLVQVVAQNIDSDAQPDGFDAWDDFAVTMYGTNQGITSINGQVTQTKTITYIVTPQKKGTFDYPALCLTDKQGKVHVSDKFKVTVGDTVQISQHTSTQPFVLQLDVDERSVFVGQIFIEVLYHKRHNLANLKLAIKNMKAKIFLWNCILKKQEHLLFHHFRHHLHHNDMHMWDQCFR